MKSSTAFFSILLFLLFFCYGNTADCLERISIPVGPDAEIIKCDGDIDKICWEDSEILCWEAPVGDRVLFAFPIPGKVNIGDFGLCKFDLRIEGGPVDVMIFLEQPGEKRMVWRPVDINMPESGWQTIHLDLNQPEIIRESHFKPEKPRLAFNFWSMNTGYPNQDHARSIAIRNVRLVKRYLEVVWNGADYSIISGSGGDLIYEYPVTVCNRDSKIHIINAKIEKTDGRYGAGEISPVKKELAPGASTVFSVKLILPEKHLKELPVLYCEWFLPVFSLNDVTDSDEGILRSSDRIRLPLINMPEPKTPVSLFDRDGLRNMLLRYRTTDWGKKEGKALIARAEKILSGDLTIPDGPGWARAYYYCHEHRCVLRYQGENKHFCPKGGEYRSVDFMGIDLDRDYRAGEHNTTAGWSRTLALAYALTGNKKFSQGALSIINQYRQSYFTYDWLDLDASTKTIDKGRLHFAKYMETYAFRDMLEAFDILKALDGITKKEARDIKTQLFVPALVEITDYRMDMLCRQTTITTMALIGGLVLNHAPLTAFAVHSPYGYFSLRKWGASADGIAHGHGYSQIGYTRHQVEMAELLHRIGIDTFDSELKRLIDGSFWWNVPMNEGRMTRIFSIASRHYPDTIYRKYARRSLIEGEPPFFEGALNISKPPSVNFPNSGLTILRMPYGDGTFDAEFKWSMPDNRGSFSVMSLGLYFYGYNCQSYPGHFHWGSTDLHHKWQIQTASHSTIVVDSSNQSGMKDYFKGHYMPHPSEQIFFEENETGAAAVAYNDRIYPGVKIWRAVCVFKGAYLIIDMLRSDSEHTYDRWFHGVPDHSDGCEGLSVKLAPRKEPFGNEDGYDMVYNLSSAVTAGDFGSDWSATGGGGKEFTLSMRALNSYPVEIIHGYEWSRQYTAPEKEFLILRRTGVKNADFTVLLEPHREKSRLSKFERIEVINENGIPVRDAVGLKITLEGKQIEVILNPYSSKIQTSSGVSGKVFILNSIENK